MNDKEADEIVAQAVARLRERREELGMSVNKLSEVVGWDRKRLKAAVAQP